MKGIPEELIRTGNEEQDVTKDKPKRTSYHKGSIMVTIRTRKGLCIQKKGLDYQRLKILVEKTTPIFNLFKRKPPKSGFPYTTRQN